jgi:NAD(P)-dependent dehydrogenase (short-subunit alcohol dehydrogenase family)
MPSVLITGANRGLGLEFARQYKADGWEVIATCRDPAKARDLAALGITAEALDVSDLAAFPPFAAGLAGRALDLFICNAGVFGGDGNEQTLGTVDADLWIETLRINTIAPLKLTEALLPALEAGRGTAIYLSSDMGSIARNTAGGRYIYRSSKVALNGVVKSLSVDLTDRGVTAVALHPGWVLTDMGGPNGQLTPEESISGMRRVIAGLTIKDTGRFLDYTGKEMPW